MKLHIQVININNLFYTKNLVQDLQKQKHLFNLTLIDQGSIEEGTKEYFTSLSETMKLNTIFNNDNVDINKLWNKFYENTEEEYLCYLNNDVRIPSNFVKDTVEIFDKEPQVGVVVHATNHHRYQKVLPLQYVILDGGFSQGWDFTIRREAYTIIPDELKFFGGDDYLFVNLFNKGWKAAVAISSPMVHFHARSRKYGYFARDNDFYNYQKLGYPHLATRSPYSRRKAICDCIVEDNSDNN